MPYKSITFLIMNDCVEEDKYIAAAVLLVLGKD